MSGADIAVAVCLFLGAFLGLGYLVFVVAMVVVHGWLSYIRRLALVVYRRTLLVVVGLPALVVEAIAREWARAWRNMGVCASVKRYMRIWVGMWHECDTSVVRKQR